MTFVIRAIESALVLRLGCFFLVSGSGGRLEASPNIKRDYVGEHRIVSSASGDMAYEYGTLDVSYDEKDDPKRHEFKAVILNIYKVKNGACQKLAGTMEPLEGSDH